MLLVIKLLSETCFLISLHIKSFVLFELILREGNDIIDKLHGLGDLIDLGLSEGTKDFDQSVVAVSKKKFSESLKHKVVVLLVCVFLKKF